MKILALEFSSDRRSVAVVANGQLWAQAHEARARESHALALVDEVLRAAGLEREEINCLAVGLGPGSYTGIRAAIALAQGWQLARGTEAIGVSSVECLAGQAHAEKMFGRVSMVIDAQRNEFYLARYEIAAAGWRELEPLRLASMDETRAIAKTDGFVIGPEVTRWFPAAHVLFPDASVLGRLAAARTSFLPADKLEPIYLRETDFVKAAPPRIIPAV